MPLVPRKEGGEGLKGQPSYRLAKAKRVPTTRHLRKNGKGWQTIRWTFGTPRISKRKWQQGCEKSLELPLDVGQKGFSYLAFEKGKKKGKK